MHLCILLYLDQHITHIHISIHTCLNLDTPIQALEEDMMLLNYKHMHIAIHISMQISHIYIRMYQPRHLPIQALEEDMMLLGCVAAVLDYSLEVCLPFGLRCSVALTELADAYTAQLARMADGNSDGEVCGAYIGD